MNTNECNAYETKEVHASASGESMKARAARTWGRVELEQLQAEYERRVVLTYARTPSCLKGGVGAVAGRV